MQKKSSKSGKRLTKKVSKKVQEQTENPIIPAQQDEDRIYCKNKNLLVEMLRWKNSTKKGLHVLKKVNGRFVETERWTCTYGKETVTKIQNGIKVEVQEECVFRDNVKTEETKDIAQHEKYKEGTQYFVKYPLNHERASLIENKKLHIKIVRKTKDYYLEDVTEQVKRMGYAFDIDDNEDHRTISNVFGIMLMKMGQKVSNHSFFRHYNKEDKEDMCSYAYQKTISGLPNYNFKYENAFAYLTQAFFNSFKSILSKHYKQINIKRACTKRAMVQLQSNLPNSSMERCLGNQFRGNDYDSFEDF